MALYDYEPFCYLEKEISNVVFFLYFFHIIAQ